MTLLAKIKKKFYKLYFDLKLFLFSKLFGIDDLSVLYNKRFFKKNIIYSDKTAKSFAAYVIDGFKPRLIYDFGCGNGIYLKYFFQKRVKVRGFDGSRAALKNSLIGKDCIKLFDLRNKINLKEKSDITICFETAEHLEAKFADILVDNLVNNSGGLIFFTAAQPGQGGTNHVNERPQSYWIEKFQKRFFIYSRNETALIKQYLKKQGGIFWIVNNIMVFKSNA